MRVAIFGAGPAGLTAAHELGKAGVDVVVFEKDGDVGGIARTVNYKNYLFDVGGHRFFTKFPEVKKVWDELLGDDFLTRSRLSRIYYRNTFFYYPLRPWNALKGLGLWTSLAVVISYVRFHLTPRRNVENLEDWVINRFGKKLFEIFFKTYTEKVWGTSCREIQADWAAQRIKSLSLGKAIVDALGFMKKGKITTLIDEFQYPRRGPGQMWQRAAELLEVRGGKVTLRSRVVSFELDGEKISSAIIKHDGVEEPVVADHYVSSIPLRELIQALRPSAPLEVLDAAEHLRYRDFFTVGLIIRAKDIFPDNWVYIHAPEVRVARVQNLKNWSPDMVPNPEMTSLEMEYFCFEKDSIWRMSDAELIALASEEAERLNFAKKADVVDGVVIRLPKTYPIYDPGYKKRIETIKAYLATITNLQTIGRNGLHRYNNQDHSMLTGILAARNILGERNDVWEVNVEDEYLEADSPGEKSAKLKDR